MQAAAKLFPSNDVRVTSFEKKMELLHSNEERCGLNKGAYSSSIPV